MYCVVDVVLSLAVKGDGNRGLLAGFPCLHAATMFCWLTIFRVRCQGRLVVTVFFFFAAAKPRRRATTRFRQRSTGKYSFVSALSVPFGSRPMRQQANMVALLRC